MSTIKAISELLRTRARSSILEEWGDRVKTREHYFSLRDERDAEIMQVDQTIFGALVNHVIQEHEKGDDFRRYRAIP
jgi:hypothetical protein